MFGSISLQNLQGVSPSHLQLIAYKSLPDLTRVSTHPKPNGGQDSSTSPQGSHYPKGPQQPPAEVKRSNSTRRGKLLQKTWDKVKTIIQPSGIRRGSKAKLSSGDVLESIRRSGGGNPSDLTSNSIPSGSGLPRNLLKSQKSVSAPATPCKKFAFDFQSNKDIDIDQAPKVNKCPPPNSPGRTGDDDSMDQVVKNYVELQKRLSDELHASIKEGRRKEEALSEDFKKKLRQWEMWKASTGKYHYTQEELLQLIPSDFSKKLQEWEDLKGRPQRKCSDPGGAGAEGSSPALEPRDRDPPTPTSSKFPTNNNHPSKSRKPKKSSEEVHRQKELASIERQLEKIEVEKRRLEREMKKYCEREARLQKMREALRNSPGSTEEVWIKTPTGAECKVEKINQKFAKRLLKWEEKQGIRPESSTMALLDPKYYKQSPPTSSSAQAQGQGQGPRHQGAQDDRENFNAEEDPLVNNKNNNDYDLRQDQQDFETHHDLQETENHDLDRDPPYQYQPSSCDKRDYSSSEDNDNENESDEVDEEYEEATDSFATKDERASGASNTDSECFNLKPGFRRRSSDAISTPLSARSPSLSGYTSEDEENHLLMLKTVNENEEERVCGGGGGTLTLGSTRADDHDPSSRPFRPSDESPKSASNPNLILKAKSIVLVETEAGGGGGGPPGVIVQTQRTIFSPVTGGGGSSTSSDLDSNTAPQKILGQPLRSPTLVKGSIQPQEFPGLPLSSTSTQTQTSYSIERKVVAPTPAPIVDQPPRVVGAIRKVHNNGNGTPFHPSASEKANVRGQGQPMPMSNPPYLKDFPLTRPSFQSKMTGKIPVWCSPLLARRRFPGGGQGQHDPQPSSSNNPSNEKFTTCDPEFSIDKFLQETNLVIPIPGSSGGRPSNPVETPAPGRISRIPITSPATVLKRKYTIGGGFPPGQGDLNPSGSPRLLGLTRSNSFQGRGTPPGPQQCSNYNFNDFPRNQGTRVPHRVQDSHGLGQGQGHSARPPLPTSPPHYWIQGQGSGSGSLGGVSPFVPKSRSTGSILRDGNYTGGGGNKGLFGLATKFGLRSTGSTQVTTNNSSSLESQHNNNGGTCSSIGIGSPGPGPNSSGNKGKIFPNWLRSSSSSHQVFKK